MKNSIRSLKSRAVILGSAAVLVGLLLGNAQTAKAEKARCYMKLVCSEWGDGCYGDLCYTPGLDCCYAQRPCVSA